MRTNDPQHGCDGECYTCAEAQHKYCSMGNYKGGLVDVNKHQKYGHRGIIKNVSQSRTESGL